MVMSATLVLSLHIAPLCSHATYCIETAAISYTTCDLFHVLLCHHH